MPYRLATPQYLRRHWEKAGDWDHLPIPCSCLGWVKGLEPSTPGTTIRCSNQLSYTHQIHGVLRPTGARRKIGTPEGTRTPGLLLRRQLLYPAELLAHMERVTRIELASPAWKAGALAIVLHPRTGPFARSTAANRQLANNNMKLQICQYLFRVFAKFFQLKSGGGEGHPSRRHRTSPPPTVASTRTVSSSSGGRTAGSRSRTIRSARFPGARVPRSPSAWYCQAAPAVKA